MKTPFKLLFALAPALLVAACGGGDDSVDDRLDIADPKVRLVHAVPLAPNVSLFRNNGPQAGDVTDIPYKAASRYFDVPTGTATWEVRTATNPAVPVGSATFDATRGNKYTLVAVPDAGSGAELVTILDPYDKDLTAKNARVRVLNAAANAPAIDVYLTPAGGTVAGSNPDFAAVGYKAAVPASGSNSVDFSGGGRAYTLSVTVQGSKTPVFTSPVTVADNEDWLLTVLPGSVAPNDVKVLLVKSDDSAPAVELPKS